MMAQFVGQHYLNTCNLDLVGVNYLDIPSTPVLICRHEIFSNTPKDSAYAYFYSYNLTENTNEAKRSQLLNVELDYSLLHVEDIFQKKKAMEEK